MVSRAYTDASTDCVISASAACIFEFEHNTAKIRIKLCLLIDPLSGSEVELVGGVLALVMGLLSKSSVIWITDSETLKNQALKIVTNNAEVSNKLWSLWFSLYNQLREDGHNFEVQWVRAHAGHKQNEACDKVCRWLRQKGEKLLSDFGEGRVGQSYKHSDWSAWVLIDGRSAFLEPNLEQICLLSAKIQHHFSPLFS